MTPSVSDFVREVSLYAIHDRYARRDFQIRMRDRIPTEQGREVPYPDFCARCIFFTRDIMA